MDVFCSSHKGCLSVKDNVELEYRCKNCKECLLRRKEKMHKSIVEKKNDMRVLASFLTGNACARRNAVVYAQVDVITKF